MSCQCCNLSGPLRLSYCIWNYFSCAAKMNYLLSQCSVCYLANISILIMRQELLEHMTVSAGGSNYKAYWCTIQAFTDSLNVWRVKAEISSGFIRRGIEEWNYIFNLQWFLSIPHFNTHIQNHFHIWIQLHFTLHRCTWMQTSELESHDYLKIWPIANMDKPSGSWAACLTNEDQTII